MTNDELPRQKFDCLDKSKAMVWHFLTFPSIFRNTLHDIKCNASYLFWPEGGLNSTNKKSEFSHNI